MLCWGSNLWLCAWQVCNPRTQEVEHGRSEVQGHSQVQSEFKASPASRHCFQNIEKGKMTLSCCVEVRKGLLGVGTSWKERHRSSNLAPEGWRKGVELLRDSEQL